MGENVECPYCGKEFEYECEDVGQYETVHIECPDEDCEKIFTACAFYSLDYTSIEKSACLNGGSHILRESMGIPEGFPRQYRCQSCDRHGLIDLFEKKYSIVQPR